MLNRYRVESMMKCSRAGLKKGCSLANMLMASTRDGSILFCINISFFKKSSQLRICSKTSRLHFYNNTTRLQISYEPSGLLFYKNIQWHEIISMLSVKDLIIMIQHPQRFCSLIRQIISGYWCIN